MLVEEAVRVHTRLMDAARDGRRAILTLGTNESDVHVQPWEMIRDTRGPLVFQGVTIRRQPLGAGVGRRPSRCIEPYHSSSGSEGGCSPTG